MKKLERITLDPKVMGGKPCIRGLRMTVGTIIGLLASGLSIAEIIQMYPYLNQKTFWKRYLMPHGVQRKLKFRWLLHENSNTHEPFS